MNAWVSVLCFALLPTYAVGAERDPFRQPFHSESIWNRPLGTGARYEYAHFKPAWLITADQEYILQLRASDPIQPVYKYGRWDHRCSGTDDQYTFVPFPDDSLVPDARPGSTPNNCAALIMPDRRTVIQLNAMARCQRGGPLYGLKYPPVDLYGPGTIGSHGGSYLSAIGGTIRRGELTSPDPIRHALKLNVWGQKYLFRYPAGERGYLWPAESEDQCAPNCYGGRNPHIRLGTLLAIPPNVPETLLKLETAAGRKVFWTLQNYGAYIVDDTAWDVYAWCVERGVDEEFRRAYGLPLESGTGPWYRDSMKLLWYLAAVTNNGPGPASGGGRLRQPPAPPLRQP